MKALDLYKFVSDNAIEYHNFTNINAEKEIWMHVPFPLLDEFVELLGATYVTDNHPNAGLCQYTMCFEMTAICDYFGIELEEVFDLNKD